MRWRDFGPAPLWDELGVFDVRELLGEITLPTLVVAGQHDTTHPPATLETYMPGLSPRLSMLVTFSSATTPTISHGISGPN